MKRILIKVLISMLIIFLIVVAISEIYEIDAENATNNYNNNYSGDMAVSGEWTESGDIENVKENEEEPVSILPYTVQIITESGEEYSANISFSEPSTYNKIEGITTFRGNNYRDSAFCGELELKEKTFTKVWTKVIGKTDNWTGVGWNGQPAIVKWDDSTKKHMNIYDEFKQKKDFVEVIYGTLDSHVYFYDLETGAETRPSIKVESSIKGSVTIDPRGYPLLYVGQGINQVSGESVRMGYHIFSLVDGKELLFINGRDRDAYSGWGAFDGNPLIYAEEDLLILPAENGLIYVVKLNTNYDIENGTISINPNITKYKWTVNGRAGGIENAIAAYKNYAYFVNNNGALQCLDLNTLTPRWSYDMQDDCDATCGLEEENGKIMLYAATEVDRRKTDAPAYVRKFNGMTGEVLWEYSCNCKYDPNVNGGVLSSPIIGKGKISNLVIYNFSKVNNLLDGKMVALNKDDGSVVWEKDMSKYSWSSPVAIYDTSGEAYIVFGNSIGQLLLIDALTGETIHTLNTGGGNIEGSPAIYNDMIVIGTRGKRIYGIKIN